MTTAGAKAPGRSQSFWSSAAYWLVPPLFCFCIYWYGILSWFQADDFAWLSLHQRVHNFHDLGEFLFTPMAQGTIRPLSERAFFLAFYHWFGLNALPWRIAVFFTQCINLALLAAVTSRITRSRVAGFAAAILWTANSALATAMSWTSDYNQILCATFLIGALACWIRFVETSRGWWFWAVVVVFVIGFGALEINVVFPALAAAYVVLLVPRERWRTLSLYLAPLVLVSIVYFAWHSAMAPGLKSGPYALHMDGSIAGSLGVYLRWVFVPSEWEGLARPRSIAIASLMIFGILMLFLAVHRWALRRVFWFGWAWFLITVAPILPLRDHRTDYYLTIPTAGVAIALAAAMRWNWKLLAPVMALYLAMMIPAASFASRWYSDRSQHVRTLVLGVITGREKHPGKPILLDGIGDELYATAIAHSPFRSLGIMDVYLAPDALHQIHSPENLVSVADNVLPPGPTLRALKEEQLVVYRADEAAINKGVLKNVTSTYEEIARQKFADQPPQRVDAGNRLDSYLMNEGWYDLEVDHRWMASKASINIGPPEESGRHLVLNGYCPVEQVRTGPLIMKVSVDGTTVGTETFSQPETPFTRRFSLPAVIWQGKQSLQVTVEVNKTFHGQEDPRQLGLAFGVFEWK